jgi:hypothetical protein
VYKCIVNFKLAVSIISYGKLLVNFQHAYEVTIGIGINLLVQQTVHVNAVVLYMHGILHLCAVILK